MSRQNQFRNNRNNHQNNRSRRHQRDYPTPSPPTNQRLRTHIGQTNVAEVSARRNLAGYAGPAGGTRLPRSTFRAEQAIDNLSSFVLTDTELEQFKRNLVGEIRYGPASEQVDNIRVRAKLQVEEIRTLKSSIDTIKSDVVALKESVDILSDKLDNQKHSNKHRSETLQFALHSKIDDLAQEVESTSRRISDNTGSIQELEKEGVAEIFYSTLNREIDSLRQEFEDKLEITKGEVALKSEIDSTRVIINANHTLLSTRIDNLVVPESVTQTEDKDKEGTTGLEEASSSDSD
jgi:hypothetical protein